MKDLVDLPATLHQLNNQRPIKSKRNRWNVAISEFARLTHNPIRAIVEGLNIQPNPSKPLIALSIGDPTTFGNLKPSQETVDAVRQALEDGSGNGYAPANGHLEAREAVARYVQHQGPVTAADVILCSGCSSALDLCISVLGGPGRNILVPKPGFSIYRTLAEGFGIECRTYDLLPERNWEADLVQLEQLIDEQTCALVVTNPGNPCGSVFPRAHLEAIVDIAERHFVPIIADEIYEHFVFPGQEFHAVSTLSQRVPVLSCGGLTKRFLVPGWRMGWIIVHDRDGVFGEVRRGLANLSVRILGSNTLVQRALPAILDNTPNDFFDDLVATLHRHAELAYKGIKQIRGLNPIMPGGAMYMMVGIDVEHFPEFETDLRFVEALVAEQSVFCLPGQCFEYPNYFRLVLTVPEEMIVEAVKRLEEFCEQHYKLDNDLLLQQQNGLLNQMTQL
ncbi:tyrosine aminotransferase [Anopheles arabiensis]|uniref:Tyrosine aminotransferase n=5 Tax=gambiae species complex TaxID=44542 RepID=Q7QF69_ANOGA|nr:tyrosine aminotransferase [Anopheles arabiensis]XP_040237222.1 tyrosine aminotransferase [Anopheles coluzzii]XP_041782440.1 tyrosine aminotransferase [Anopheles merus]XP_310789.4 tyrosine aminotransferase [Anopheles gambiae]EAA06243.4 AGAP000327-PA [Anopheles gambiae str. PEST]